MDMDYKSFKEKVKAEFLNYLPVKYRNYTIRVHPVIKTNVVLDGLSIIFPDYEKSNLSPTIYINHMYDDYLNGNDFQSILRLAALRAIKTIEDLPYTSDKKITLDILMKEPEKNIIISVVNTELNKEMLNDVPHRDFIDLSIVYRYILEISQGDIASILVTNAAAEELGMSEQQLYDNAFNNTRKLLQPEVIYDCDSLLSYVCLLYKSASPRARTRGRIPSSC